MLYLCLPSRYLATSFSTDSRSTSTAGLEIRTICCAPSHPISFGRQEEGGIRTLDIATKGSHPASYGERLGQPFKRQKKKKLPLSLDQLGGPLMAMDSGEKHSGREPTTPIMAAAETAPKLVDDAEATTPKTTRDSMVTVRLSEPPALSLDTSSGRNSKLPDSPTLPATSQPIDDSSLDACRNSTATVSASAEASRSLHDELEEMDDGDSDCSDPEEVNWAELEKTEDEQTKDEETDNVRAQGISP